MFRREFGGHNGSMAKKTEKKIAQKGDKKKRKDKDSPGHSKHLCAVIAGGYGFKQVHALVGDPRFICAKCGRSAENKRNLCKERQL